MKHHGAVAEVVCRVVLQPHMVKGGKAGHMISAITEVSLLKGLR